MGEMADYYLDLCDFGMNEDPFDDYRSPCNAWFPKEKKIIKCDKCGSTNVKWGQYPSGKWFLFTDGKPHKCEGK